MDLLDLWHGRLSIRRIGVLVKSLLQKAGRSTLAMAVNETAEWGTTDYLLARISDALETSNYLFLQVNSAEGADIPFPDSIPRPGQEVEEVTSSYEYASGDEVANFLTQMSAL
ncbi:hypothetical protein ACFQ71_03025 [Streptomyces sp. NPDC056534]|uniref:hypothetical protein n=1 Tax=Streptomyces sp. NPDC056534 TaxID=3345857 RepID=UPI0036CA2E94